MVESADAQDLFAHPRHPYTRALIGPAPVPDPRAAITAAAPPTGCHFHTRCIHAQERCRASPAPALEPVGPGHLVRCWRVGEI